MNKPEQKKKRRPQTPEQAKTEAAAWIEGFIAAGKAKGAQKPKDQAHR